MRIVEPAVVGGYLVCRPADSGTSAQLEQRRAHPLQAIPIELSFHESMSEIINNLDPFRKKAALLLQLSLKRFDLLHELRRVTSVYQLLDFFSTETHCTPASLSK